MATEHEQPVSEADILADVVGPDEPGMAPELASAILALRFSDSAIARMNELAEKNRQGTLSEAERTCMENYLRVGNFLNLLQARARLSLKSPGRS